MEQRQDRNSILVLTIVGGIAGVVISLFREWIAQTPLVFIDAVGLWALYISGNVLLASFATAIYTGLVFCLTTLCIIQRKLLLLTGLVAALLVLHVVLIRQLDLQLAPAIGEGFRLLFSR